MHKELAKTVHGVKPMASDGTYPFFLRVLLCVVFGLYFIRLHKECSPLGFGPGNARARSGCLTAASEMGFEFQGRPIETEVAVLLRVW